MTAQEAQDYYEWQIWLETELPDLIKFYTEIYDYKEKRNQERAK